MAIRPMSWDEFNDFNYSWNSLAGTPWNDLVVTVYDSQINFNGQVDIVLIGVGLEQARINFNGLAETQIVGVAIEQSLFKLSGGANMQVVAFISTKDFKSYMIRYMPLYHHTSYITNNLLNSYAEELRRVDFGVNDLRDNLFPVTSTTMLARWEAIVGLKPDDRLSFEFRRKRILTKLKAVGSVTKQSIRELVEFFGFGNVEIIEDNPSYKFIVKFVGTGAPTDTTLIDQLLEDVKPAHIGYEYEYTYKTWDFVSNNRWVGIVDQTWNELSII